MTTRQQHQPNSTETTQWMPDQFERDAPGEPRSDAPDQFSVIIHDDDSHSCRDFVEVLQNVFDYEQAAAYQLTREIGLRGRTIVWTGKQDAAEQKAQKARDYHPEWRRARSTTAPRRVAEYVPPLTITVELTRRLLKSASNS